MRARLVSLDGHCDILLRQTVILVGRHTHCDVRLDSGRVSRRHCCLVLEDGHLVVRDLDSTNGTRVNGELVSVGRMLPGDELIIGQNRYRLVLEPDDPAEASMNTSGKTDPSSATGGNPSGHGTSLFDVSPRSEP